MASSRHHYIPKYYLDNFTNESHFLYVYDKSRDIISKKSRSGKSLFFEDDLNSFKIGEGKSSILEDMWYSKLDSQFAPYIKRLANNPYDEKLLTDENLRHFHAFLQSLFWGTPVGGVAFDYLMDRSSIKFIENAQPVENPEQERALKNDEAYRKLKRSEIFSRILNIDKKEGDNRKYMDGLFEFDHPALLVSDFPCLFSRIPHSFQDLDTLEFFCPVSSRRIFTHRKVRQPSLTTAELHQINAAIIDQSMRFVCGPSLKMLEQHIAYYRILRDKGFLLFLREKIFLGI